MAESHFFCRLHWGRVLPMGSLLPVYPAISGFPQVILSIYKLGVPYPAIGGYCSICPYKAQRGPFVLLVDDYTPVNCVNN